MAGPFVASAKLTVPGEAVTVSDSPKTAFMFTVQSRPCAVMELPYHLRRTYSLIECRRRLRDLHFVVQFLLRRRSHFHVHQILVTDCLRGLSPDRQAGEHEENEPCSGKPSEPGPYCGRLFIGYHDCPPPICSKGTSPSKRKGTSRPEVVCNQCVAASELRSESLGLHHYEICVVD